MKKSNTDHLLSLTFIRLCVANFMLFAAVYLLVPCLPVEAAVRWKSIHGTDGGCWMLVLFVAGMLLAGPFHAYLGDAYKRKHVLLYSLLCMAGLSACYAHADAWPLWPLLLMVHGVCFGLATTAGITVAIDVVASARRSAGNGWYALTGRLGMLAGAVVGACMGREYGFAYLSWISVACCLIASWLVLRTYVAFRAPIGVPLLNLDRFLLPAGWVPGINLLTGCVAGGMLLALAVEGEGYEGLACVLAVACVVPAFTRIFVKLSHHCQRGTANTTCQLSIDAGMLMGLAAGGRMLAASFSRWQVIEVALPLLAASVLFYVFITIPYYKKKRVR